MNVLSLFVLLPVSSSSSSSGLSLRQDTSRPLSKMCCVPGLHEHSTRSREFADEAFRSGYIRDDASGSDALHNVLCVPSHEVAVVDDVLFARLELLPVSLWTG